VEYTAGQRDAERGRESKRETEKLSRLTLQTSEHWQYESSLQICGGLSHANLFEVSLIKRVEGKKMIKNSLG